MKEEVSIKEQKGRRNLYLGTTIVSALSTGVVAGITVAGITVPGGFVLMPLTPIALAVTGGATIGNGIAWRRKANVVSDLEFEEEIADSNEEKIVKTAEDETVKVKRK